MGNAMLDENANGVSDIWEQKYNAADLVATAAAKLEDFDSDGHSNFSEANAGTDPRDNTSYHRIDSITKATNSVTLNCPTEKGKKYETFGSATMGTGTWTSQSAAAIADQTTMNAVLNNQNPDRLFYRVDVSDADVDGDGLTNWEEEQLAGYDPNSPTSFPNDDGDGDGIIIIEQMGDLANVTITASSTDAYEKEASTTKFTFTRTNLSFYPLTVFFSLSGNSDQSKGSASPSDYNLVDSLGAPVQKFSITIPAGQLTADLVIQPVDDNQAEVPETLTCTISNTAKTASVRICDAANTNSNRRLFVARLSPIAGTNSTGSGVASMLLNGDNDLSYITMSFSGLKTAQKFAHIQYSNQNSQINLKGFFPGQLSNAEYPLRAAQFLSNDQDILDALLNGLIVMNVESIDIPEGEIRGPFLESTGTEIFVAPAAPPAIENLTGDDLDSDIMRFLTQSSFGATPDSFAQMQALVATHGGDRMAAYSSYIDQQLGLNSVPPAASPSLEIMVYAADAQENYLASIVGSPDYDITIPARENNLRQCWWTLSYNTEAQLRHRAAFALSQILVISSNDAVIDRRQYGMANYYDLLATGVDGSYRDLLENVSKHPVMGQYLSSLRNGKATAEVSPDENYAREVMQLFSIGLINLHEDGSLKLASTGLPIPTYGQDDISAMARIFTGWGFAVKNDPTHSSTIVVNNDFELGGGASFSYQDRWTTPMKMFPSYHDTDAKIMPLLGLTTEAGKTGEEDLDTVIDYLAAHPSTAPFIIRRLIQRMVTSNPSNGYIYRVTQVWNSSGGNIAQVIKAILLDYEARSLTPTLASSYGKKKEPLLHFIGYTRCLNTTSNLPLSDLNDAVNLSSHAYSATKYGQFAVEFTKFPAGSTRFRMSTTDSSLAQTPLSPLSVFNYYLPDYSPAGTISTNGLSAPEFQIANEITVITHINQFNRLFNTSGASGRQVPNQGETDPAHNPYNYATNDDHIVPDRDPASSHFIKKYLAIMDTNNDGKVNDLDTTFDQPEHIYAACAALVDELDLYLTAGQLKKRFAAGYSYQTIREDNPRDLIIDAVRLTYDYYDDDGVSNPADANFARDEGRQLTVLQQRLRYASYLIAISPYGTIQR